MRLHRPRHAPIFSVGPIFLIGVLLLTSGCTRRYWRNQADDVAVGLMRQFSHEAHQSPRDAGSQPAPESRLFDPFNPDFPPMPPDDLIAHSRMVRVDGMRTYRWDKRDHTPVVDLQNWLNFLPRDEEGHLVLDLTGAVQLAYVHSREYRKELEDLYLSALDVSFERFRFSSQFFATNGTFFNTDGRLRNGNNNSVSQLRSDDTLTVTRLFAAGGTLVVDLANTIVWQFSGPDTNANTTLLDFTFIQPLARLGGRARVLERLTLVERQLIYNVRQMEFYRQGFYAQVATGRAAADGPNRRGGVSGAGLQGFTGFGGGFGRINVQSATASGVVGAGGFLGLLQDQIGIRNQEANVTTLRDSLTRLQDEFDADRIKDKFQVELARQALYEGQSKLLAAKATYQSELDTFKVFLGLPPDLDVTVRDPQLSRFELIDPETTRLTERAGRIVLQAHGPAGVTEFELAELLDGEKSVRGGVVRHLGVVANDLRVLQENFPQRVRQLERLMKRPEVAGGDVPLDAYSVAALAKRRDALLADFSALEKGLEDTWTQLESLRTSLSTLDPKQARDRLDRIHPILSSQLLALSLAQARARVDSIVWTPIDISWQEAVEVARYNRRDWANARANLVDTWRLIEFNANALKAGMNVVINGDMTTTHDNPVAFRDVTGRLRFGLQFDAPLTRVAERNIYRQSLIEYQQARRAYMLYEDRVCQSLRSVLRTIELNQLNFEIRRSAVQVAIQQVDLARETLSRPLRPMEEAADYAAARASIGRDLVTALGSLLDDQNNFLAVWVSYEVQRLGLDLEMGTMQLDDRGMWIDPGPIQPGDFSNRRDCPPEELVPGPIEGETLPAPPADGVGPELKPPPVPNFQPGNALQQPS